MSEEVAWSCIRFRVNCSACDASNMETVASIEEQRAMARS
jgi:hypothetical protein